MNTVSLLPPQINKSTFRDNPRVALGQSDNLGGVQSWTVKAQGSLVKLKAKCALPDDECPDRPDQPTKRGGLRGRVDTFSDASRRRLIQLFATLLFNPQRPPLFVTLTYPAQFPTARRSKKHLRAFLKRLERCYPEIAAVWRLEFQKRGAPHFHLLLFNVAYINYLEINEMWRKIIKAEVVRTDIQAVLSARGLMSYCSKYIAKADAPASASGSLVHSAYLSADESVGRFWGYFNADKLPFAELFETVITGDRFAAIYTFRRYMKCHYANLHTSTANRGGFVLVGNADRWIDLLFECLVGEQSVCCTGKMRYPDPVRLPGGGGGEKLM